MTVYPLFATFARGELSPRLHARADTEHYQMALATARNWIVMRQGGVRRRPGFIFIGPLRDQSEKGRVVRFEFNAEQAYALVFNDDFIRFYTSGGVVTQTAQNITGISKANPGVVTYNGTDTYSNGDRVWISGVVGMTEVNNREFAVANVDAGANTFELSGINTSSYTTWSSGGTVAEIYEIASPYPAADIFELQFAQSGDTIYIAHPDYAPRKLVRTSELSWAISTISFEDGPYLDEDEQGTYMTPASTGGVTPDMTGLTSPSGTAADDDADADAWEVFDRDTATTINMSGLPAWVSYDFDAAATKIADAYWIQASPNSGDVDNAPTAWNFEGYNGAAWIVLDTRNGETGWATGERRYFEFPNEVGYQSYRLYVTSAEASSTCIIAEIGIHEEGNSQTAFNLTASAVTGINDGAGFASTDVGRTIRLMGTDGEWRWARIIAYSSTTLVTIRLYAHALPNLDPITRWQMSAWSVTNGYPACVGFFEDRLAWGASTTQPRTVWLSKVSDYENHGTTTPSADNDGIAATMTGGRLNKITFLEELADLAIGTAGSMRIMGPSDSSEPFSNTNIRQKQQTTTGAAAQQPIVIGSTMIYADRYKKALHEFAYSFESNGYVSKELSILSDHLFRETVVESTFQEGEDDIAWFVTNDGALVALTYEPAQQIAGITPVIVEGGDADTDDEAVVESIASIPSSGGSVLYAVVKRTIDGGTTRYVEYLAPFYETGDTLTTTVYADSALTYNSSAVASITGAYHLRSESVGVFADGIDVGDATVSSTGGVTLASVTAHTGVTVPSTASVITIGKRYNSRGVTLRVPQSGNKDGSALSRKMAVHAVRVDMLDTDGLLAGTQVSTRACPRSDEAADDGELNTGMFDVITSDKHRNDGVMVFETDKMYPATIRGVMLELEGEP